MMDLTPLEVRKKKGDFRRQLRGYDPALVDDFLDLVADRLEQLVRENMTLNERAGRLEQLVADFRERERAMTDALVTAQEMREAARTQIERETELARQRGEHEIARVRVEAQAAREREAEALRRLVMQRKQFLQAFRSYLERELGDIGAEEKALEMDASRATGEIEAVVGKTPPAPPVANVPVASAPPMPPPAPPPVVDAAPESAAVSAEPEPAATEPESAAPEPAPSRPQVVETRKAPRPVAEPAPPWSFDDPQPVEPPASVPEPAVLEAAPTTDAEEEQEDQEKEEPPVAAAFADSPEDRVIDSAELEPVAESGDEDRSEFDFDAALASIGKLVSAEIEELEADPDGSADELMLSEDEIVTDEEILLEDLGEDEVRVEPPRMGLDATDDPFDIDDFGLPPEPKSPPPLWEPEPATSLRSSAGEEKKKSEASAKRRDDPDDDVDDMLANLFGDGI